MSYPFCVNSEAPVSISIVWFGAVFDKISKEEFRQLKWLWPNWVKKWYVCTCSWNTWGFAFWLKCTCLYNLKVSPRSQNYCLSVIHLKNGSQSLKCSIFFFRCRNSLNSWRFKCKLNLIVFQMRLPCIIARFYFTNF